MFWSLNCSASFWSAIAKCLKNPCNCGYGTKYELWNRESKDKGDENPLCPPWNKGRDDNTCLTQFDYPGVFIAWYLKHCAEATNESTYFSPKIRLRYQACNIAACWTNSTTLNWDGDCVNWPTAYALPLLRICARIAVPETPADLGDPLPADPGYTKGRHLNTYGAEEADEEFPGDDGKSVMLTKPKLCAYKDPSLVDTVTTLGALGVDLMDWNPTNQAMHNTGELHPIAKVLIFLVTTVINTGNSLRDMIGSLLDAIGGVIIPGLDLFKVIFDAINAIMDYIGSIFIAILKEFGQFNRVVDSYKFGCVEVPVGPYPPPYCPQLTPFIPSPTTNAICEVGGYSNNTVIPLMSTSDHKCVVSQLVNNFVRNSIRISFDNFVPLCRNKEDPTKTDKCVEISGPFSGSAKGIHTASGFWDVIPSCTDSPGSVCVRTKIKAPQCNPGANSWCLSGFRVAYGSSTGKTSVPSNYFINGLVGCDENSGGTCQKVWGVNTGAFIDVSLIFPKIEDGYNMTLLKEDVSLNDTNGNARKLSVVIRRQSTAIADMPRGSETFQQDPKQICVFGDDNDLVGCENRITMKPKVKSKCASSLNSGYFVCQNDGKPCTSSSGTQYQGTVDYQSISSTVCGKIITTSSAMQACPSPTAVMCKASADATCQNAGAFCISSSGDVVSCQDNSSNVCTNSALKCTSPSGMEVSCSGISSTPKVLGCQEANQDPDVSISSELRSKCKNDYFKPAFIVVLKSGKDYTSAVMQPLSVNNFDIYNYRVNLAGYDFTSNVTDDKFTQKPFSGLKSINPSSIYGDYKPGPDDKTPAPYVVQGDGSLKEVDGVYLTGLEYVGGNDNDPKKPDIREGKYIQGGTFTCLQVSTMDRCSAANTTSCVLAKLLEEDTVNCVDFANKAQSPEYVGKLHLCDSTPGLLEKLLCVLEVGSLPGINGGAGITIKSCPGGTFCYTNDKNSGREVCKVGLLNNERYKPDPNYNIGASLSDNDFYDLNGSPGAGYDKTKYVLRDKTPVELGLCTTIPRPKCQAITSPDWANGAGATWPETDVGMQAVGKCPSGYSTFAPLTRYCIANASKMTVAFEKLDKDADGNTISCMPGAVQFSNTHTFPASYAQKKTANSYEFGTDKSNTVGGPNTFTSTLQFNIQDLSKVSYFRIAKIGYDDWVQVKVNGNFVAGQKDFKLLDIDLTKADSGQYRSDLGTIDIKSKLQPGFNNIKFELNVTGGGSLYYKIEYGIND